MRPANPSTALAEAWEQWTRHADEQTIHTRLTRIAPGRPSDPSHVRNCWEALSRGVSLLQAALNPSGVSGKSVLADQWRLVMGCAGFDLIVRALLDAPSHAGLRG